MPFSDIQRRRGTGQPVSLLQMKRWEDWATAFEKVEVLDRSPHDGTGKQVAGMARFVAVPMSFGRKGEAIRWTKKVPHQTGRDIFVDVNEDRVHLPNEMGNKRNGKINR